MRVLAEREEWVNHKQIADIACASKAAQCNCPRNTPSGDDMDVEGRVAESGASGKCESVEVAREVNELWWADLKLHEQRLKVARKQLARQEHLIGAVESLSNALAHSGLVGGSAQGRVGGSRSTWKGKGKAVDGGSGGEESDEEDGEGEDADEGE